MNKRILVASTLLFISLLFCSSLSISAESIDFYPNDSKTFYVRPTAEAGAIQSAIQTAKAGDTVVVSAGTYFETIVIDKSITLVGGETGESIIDGNGQNAIEITSDQVTITGFTITNAEYGIKFGTDDNTIEDNIIKNSMCGIRLEKTGFFAPRNNLITNNRFIDNDRNTFDEGINQWESNYYDDWFGNSFVFLRFLPYIIPGRLLLNIDLTPLTE